MRYLLILLFAGCAAVTVPPDDNSSPICKVPEHRFMEVITSILDYHWERRFGPMPEHCKTAGFQVVIAAGDPEYYATCPPGTRACQLTCGGVYTALIHPNYMHDWDLIPHEYAHAMDSCVNDNVDYEHENPELWGTCGFVMSLMPEGNPFEDTCMEI